jgi:hypothetical protein
LASLNVVLGCRFGREAGLGVEDLMILFAEKVQQVSSFDGELVKPLGGHRNRLWGSEVACQPDHHQHKASAYH